MRTRTSGLRGETYLKGAKLLLLVRHLLAGTSAREAAEIVGVNKDTASKVGRMMREGKLPDVTAEARRLSPPVLRTGLPTSRSVRSEMAGHLARGLVAALDVGDLESARVATEAIAKLLAPIDLTTATSLP